MRQFSWFMVVSRPVKDSCSLTSAGTLLVSSNDPGIKLHFPPDSTLENRTVTLQVKPSDENLSFCLENFSVMLSLGAPRVCSGGTASVWRSSGQSQPSPLPLPESKQRFPAASQGSGPPASWSHRCGVFKGAS